MGDDKNCSARYVTVMVSTRFDGRERYALAMSVGGITVIGTRMVTPESR
jgi:hypothetical protein